MWDSFVYGPAWEVPAVDAVILDRLLSLFVLVSPAREDSFALLDLFLSFLQLDLVGDIFLQDKDFLDLNMAFYFICYLIGDGL